MSSARERPSLIFLSMHLPSENVPEAGQKICFHHLKTLSHDYDVHLISCVNTKEFSYLRSEDFSFCSSTYFVPVTRRTRLANLLRNVTLPYQVAVRRDPAILSAVSRLAQEGVSAIHIEYEHGAFVLDDVKGLTYRTVVFHDVISQSADRRARLAKGFLRKVYFGIQARLARNWETRLLPKIESAVVLNEKDRQLLKDAGFRAAVVVDYPQVSPRFELIRRDRYEPHTMLFWGAMNRSENEDAVLWFMSSVMPQVLAVIPDATLLVVGANPSEKVKALASSKVVVTGFVDDPAPYFERAAIAVVPLRFGAGIKLKVLEALAAKVPVVGTSVAAEGVRNDDNLIVADSERDFAAMVVQALAKSGPAAP